VLRRLLGATAFIAVVSVSGRAHAQDAQSLFDEGLSNMKVGRYKLGCALIKKSLDVDARPGTLFTLAECYSRGGKYASAVSLYDRFLAVYEGMPADEQAQQQARAELSRSERTRLVALVAWLTVQLPASAPPAVAVTLDDEEFAPGLFGVATAVDPGPHIFTTHAPNGPLIEQRVDIAPAERKSVVLEVQTSGLVPADTLEDGNGASDGEPRRKINPWVWVTGGVGAAGLVTGSVTGVLLLGKRSTIKSHCPGPTDAEGHVKCDDTGIAAVHTAQNTLAPITTVALSIGAAGALATVLVLVLENGKPGTAQGRAIPTLELSQTGGSIGLRTVF
jgi:hypothetical protein